jgi:hypothetical protein
MSCDLLTVPPLFNKAKCYTGDMYNLPKGYLSHSSMSLWHSSKDQYRKKYYGSDTYDLDTVYTRLGKEVAEILEDPKAKKKHPQLKKVPAYKIAEHQIEQVIDGVPIKGFVDSFDPEKKRIIEYKTGIRKDGVAPWDTVKVKKHNQVLLYALCTKEATGEVDKNTKLIWLETAWLEKCEVTEFNNQSFTSCNPTLQLTGHFEVFKRKLEDWEFDWMRSYIVKTATAISDDYTAYLKASGKNVDNIV